MNMHGLNRFEHGLNRVKIIIFCLTIFRVGWTTLKFKHTFVICCLLWTRTTSLVDNIIKFHIILLPPHPPTLAPTPTTLTPQPQQTCNGILRNVITWIETHQFVK